MTLIGYTRTGSRPRKPSAQEDLASRLKALKNAGCSEIVHEYATVRTRVRPRLIRTLNDLGPGDTLIATDLACVAWSLPQLIELLTSLRDRGIIFRSLESPIDTSGASGAVILETLLAMLAFNKALGRHAKDPHRTPPAATPERIRIMEVAARLVAEQPGMTLIQVASEFKRLGYRPPRGGTDWSRSSVQLIVDRARRTGILIEK
jgi:Resolvase, N terminal domain